MSGSVMKFGIAKPASDAVCTIRPAPPSIIWNSETTSTQLKKCGRYTTPCTRARTRGDMMLLSRIARAIGIGK